MTLFYRLQLFYTSAPKLLSGTVHYIIIKRHGNISRQVNMQRETARELLLRTLYINFCAEK
jgi:hypothetical protein